MLPKVLLIDLDDTLVTFGASPDAAWRKVALEVAPCEGLEANELWQSFLAARDWFWGDPVRSNRGRRDMAAARNAIVAHALEALGTPNASLAAEWGGLYSRYRDGSLALTPGATFLLKQLREGTERMLLLTNGDSKGQRRKLTRFGLEGFFDHLLIEEELGFGKPDRRVFERALTLAGVNPADAWMVGDNYLGDVLGAKACGIHAVWLDHAGSGVPDPTHISQLDLTGTRLDRSLRPDRVIRTLQELVE